MSSADSIILKLFEAIKTYNPVALAYAYTIIVAENDRSNRCPLPFWGLFSIILCGAFSCFYTIVPFVYVQDYRHQGERRVLSRLALLDDQQKLEEFDKMCRERGIEQQESIKQDSNFFKA
ncbi:hypothetical protein N431DRAFT_468287 [Stipitochalara longipes BDJ]|nr:hypothetical protein N431DRAFT_468287 [Stipitochalara longipes BDJ]